MSTPEERKPETRAHSSALGKLRIAVRRLFAPGEGHEWCGPPKTMNGAPQWRYPKQREQPKSGQSNE